MTRTLPTSAAMLLLGLLAACGRDPGIPDDAGRGADGWAGTDGGRESDGGVGLDAGPGSAADASEEGDAPVIDAASASAVCPPVAPFGPGVGDVAPDITLLDCDGRSHSLHALCDRDVVWLFEFADWCPPCRSFAMSEANDLYDANLAAHPGAFEGWMVISETASFGAPTAATCADVRDRYGVHMPVLIDPDGVLRTALGVAPNEIHVVLERGARIRWVGHYAGDEVAAQIDLAFAP